MFVMSCSAAGWHGPGVWYVGRVQEFFPQPPGLTPGSLREELAFPAAPLEVAGADSMPSAPTVQTSLCT